MGLRQPRPKPSMMPPTGPGPSGQAQADKTFGSIGQVPPMPNQAPEGETLDQLLSLEASYIPRAMTPPTQGVTPPSDGLPSDEDLLKIANGGVSEQVSAVTKKLYEEGFWEQMANRASIKTGVTTEAQLDIAKKKYKGRKVEEKDGQIFVDGEEVDPFHAPKGKGTREFFADIADWAPEIVEGVITAIGAAKGFAGGGVPGAVIGGVSSAVAAGVGRGVIADQLGSPFDVEKQFVAGAETAATMYAAEVAWPLAKNSIKNGWAKLTNPASSREMRIGDIAIHLDAMDETARAIAPHADPQELMNSVRGILLSGEKEMGKRITFHHETAIALGEGRRFMPENLMTSMQKVITEGGGEIDSQTQRALMPSRGNKPFGSPKGMKVMDGFVNGYNQMLDEVQNSGGLTIGRIYDEARALYTMAKKESLPVRLNPEADANIFRQLDGLQVSAAMDRNELTKKLYSENLNRVPKDLAEDFIDAYSTYNKNVDAVRVFKKAFHSEPEVYKAFEKAFLSKKISADDLIKMKAFMGDGHEWNQLRASWISRSLKESITEGSGKFNADNFLGRVRNLGETKSKLMMGPEELKAFELNARVINSIPKDDLYINPKYVDSWWKLLSGIKGFKSNPKALATTVVDLTSGNATLIDYISDTGFMKFIKEEATKEGKENLIKAYKVFELMKKSSKQVGAGPSRRYYMPPLFKANLLATMMPNGAIVKSLNPDEKPAEVVTPEGQAAPERESTGDAGLDAFLRN